MRWEHRPGGLEAGACWFPPMLPGVPAVEVINQRARLFDTLLLHQPQHRSPAERTSGAETAMARRPST